MNRPNYRHLKTKIKNYQSQSTRKEQIQPQFNNQINPKSIRHWNLNLRFQILKIYNIGKYQHCWGNLKAIKDVKADISAWREEPADLPDSKEKRETENIIDYNNHYNNHCTMYNLSLYNFCTIDQKEAPLCWEAKCADRNQ